MALVECRECGREVSTEATACPHCGVPSPGVTGDLREESCSECGRTIVATYEGPCPHCGMEYPFLDSLGGRDRKSSSSNRSHQSEKPDNTAGCLGLLLGPVGLWYKGQWAAGFAWLVIAIIGTAGSGGILAPLFWIGMAIHAYKADVT